MCMPEDVSAQMRLNEIIRRWPETVRVFHDLGMDACCGGEKTVEEAAAAHRLPIKDVLALLKRATLSAPAL